MINIFNNEILLTLVAEWFEEQQLPALIPRSHASGKIENLQRILAIVGPRRSGKTYFMYQLIESLLTSQKYSKKDILFIDFEDYRLAHFAENNMDDLFTAFHQLAGKYPVFLFFDEVQHLPNWNRVLRTLHNRRRFKIVVSGSNSKLLGSEVSTELRGRYEDILMLPFSFQEYLGYRNISYTQASLRTASRGTIIAAFDDYLKHGGFPEVVMASRESEQRKLLQNYFKSILYRDIIERYNIKARSLLDMIMNDILNNYSAIFSISRFEKMLKANKLPGSKRTISNYLQYLREAFFIIVNDKFSYSARRRIMNPKKVYLTDTGFAAIGHPIMENRGRLLENIVAIELFRRGVELYYFKDKKECDFIAKQDSGLMTSIQVCWELNNRNEKRELAGLNEACDSFNLTSGIILTYAQEEKREIGSRTISILPVWKWLLNASEPGLSL